MYAQGLEWAPSEKSDDRCICADCGVTLHRQAKRPAASLSARTSPPHTLPTAAAFSGPSGNGMSLYTRPPTTALHRGRARPSHICTGTRLAPPTSLRDWAHCCHICTRTWAHPCHICSGTWAHPCHICTGTASPLPYLHRDFGPPLPRLHRDLGSFARGAMMAPLGVQLGAKRRPIR